MNGADRRLLAYRRVAFSGPRISYSCKAHWRQASRSREPRPCISCFPPPASFFLFYCCPPRLVFSALDCFFRLSRHTRCAPITSLHPIACSILSAAPRIVDAASLVVPPR
ncbi:hypothetical protein HDV64DRAFT_49987 [Trichoderma sp. TUCIM 5745]